MLSGTREVLSEHQEACLCFVGGGALAEAAQRGGGVTSLEIFRCDMDMGLGTLFWVSLLVRGWSRWTQSALPTSAIWRIFLWQSP